MCKKEKEKRVISNSKRQFIKPKKIYTNVEVKTDCCNYNNH